MKNQRTLKRKPKTKNKIKKEFKQWIRAFLDEDKDLLDELANR